MNIKHLVPIFFTIMLTFTGCAAKSSQMANDMSGFEGPSFDSGESVVKEEYGMPQSAITNTAATDSGRVVIKNASLEIIVDDPVLILKKIGQMAEESGGFIIKSNTYKVNTAQGLEVPAADISVRVPAEQLEEILKQIEALLTDPEKDVQYENITGQDVTAEYTDLQSRLRNLEDAQKQLQAIMDEANRTEDVLAVYNQLTSVNEQIEVLRGQIKYYDESAKLSALDVHIIAREGIQEISIGGWEPAGVARKAIQALIDTLKFLGDAAIWVVLYLLPTAICILIPIFLVFVVIRSIVRRRKQKQQQTIVSPDISEPPVS